MQAPQIASGLEAFNGRGAGTDAERRAARWLAKKLAETGRKVVIETFWCRPNWALAHAWHVALALAGSLVSVGSPRVGGALLLTALVFVVIDELTGFSPGRRLTPERASQNVIALAPDRDPERLSLIVTANYDTGRAGLAYRAGIRRRLAGARRLVGAFTPGWLGWLVIAIAWLVAVAVLRIDGRHGTAIGVAQLPPTIGLVLGLALLLDLSIADFAHRAPDNRTGVGVALALVKALDTARHADLVTDVVLTGAGDTGGIGLRRYLKAHRTELPAATTAVLGIAPCTAGRVHWWRSDGPLWPLLYGRTLRRLAADVESQASYLGARRRDGRGSTPAFPARRARIPAIALGCLDDRDLAPRSQRGSDTADTIDPAAADAAVQFGLLLADAIDAALRATRA